MTAESGGTTVLGKQVSDLQSDVSVGTDAITGSLIYNEGWESGPLEGPGYYMALKFTASNWNNYDSVRVGLDPSEGTGLVDVLSDPDKNGVFKITNKATQKFVVEARKGATVVRKEWSLAGLTLTEPVAPSYIFNTNVDADIVEYFIDRTTTVDIDVNQENVTITDDTDSTLEGNYTGTLSATLTEIFEDFEFTSPTQGDVTLNATGGVLALNFNDFYSDTDPLMTMEYKVNNSSNTTVFSGTLCRDVGEQIHREEPVGLFIPQDHSKGFNGIEVLDDCGTIAELVITIEVNGADVATITYAIGGIIIS